MSLLNTEINVRLQIKSDVGCYCADRFSLFGNNCNKTLKVIKLMLNSNEDFGPHYNFIIRKEKIDNHL